jgi:predicted alpha-1,2-mannosidase
MSHRRPPSLAARRPKLVAASVALFVTTSLGCSGSSPQPAADAASDVSGPSDVIDDVAAPGDDDSSDSTGELDAADSPDGAQGLVESVNPLVATGGVGFFVGSGLPGPSLPHGLAKPGPDTTGPFGDFPAYHCGGYHALDDVVIGFSHTHLYGVGINEYGNILLTAALGPPRKELSERANYESPFRKETETAEVGYYAVTLDKPKVRAELTATERGAHHRYTFEGQAPQPLLVLDLSHATPSGEITDSALAVLDGGVAFEGWVDQRNDFSGRYGGIRIHFAGRFNRPPSDFATWSADDFGAGVAQRNGPRTGAQFAFSDEGPVEAAVAISFTSVANARLNLDAELPTFDFEATRAKAVSAWSLLLDKFRITGGSAEHRAIFATAIYHIWHMPNYFFDVNREFVSFDRSVQRADGFDYYTDFSMWDTYRTLHPFVSLVTPERSRDMVLSLLEMARTGGYLPKWPQGYGYTNTMNGTPADIVITDAFLRGVTGFDPELALAHMLDTANGSTTGPFEGREGIQSYLAHGYIAADESGEGVSATLEHAHADFAIAGLSRALGREEQAETFEERARFAYQTLWDPESAFLRGRNADGSWAPLDPYAWEPYYTEGNAWQYTWMVPWDGPGLVELFGSTESFLAKLEEFFEQGKVEYDAIRASNFGTLEALLPLRHYWHSNEPAIHAAYLFVWAGRPDLTQKWVHWIANNLYRDTPDGIPGNDDAGTLSAWYAFSALGLFPIPGTDLYVLGTPLFPRVEVDLPGGTLTIEAVNWAEGQYEVATVELNGSPVNGWTLRHADLARGGTLRFTMGASARR